MEPIDIEIKIADIVALLQGEKLQMCLRYAIHLIREDTVKMEEGTGKEIALKLFMETYNYTPFINSFPANFYEENKDTIDGLYLAEQGKFSPLLTNKLNECVEKTKEKIQMFTSYSIYLLREEYVVKLDREEIKEVALKLFMETYNCTPYFDSFPANFYQENKNIIDGMYIEEQGKFLPLLTDKVKEFTEKLNKELERRKLLKDYERNNIRRAILEKERKKQLQNEVYKKLVDEGHIKRAFFDSDTRREPIPQDVMDKVWNRDNGKCVKCGSQVNLEFDHIIPHSKGGATSYRNLQILCKKCNVEKTNKIG